MIRWRDARWWLGFASVGLVLAIVVYVTPRTAPGPLSPTHAGIAGTGGLEGCVLCHGESGSGTSMGCATCHGAILEEARTGAGFHGGLPRSEECARCHREHHGDQVRLVDEHAFRLAGIEERNEFDHRGLAFELEDVHTELACEACHVRAQVPFLEEGLTRYRGLVSTCSTCHEDPHAGSLGTSCADCHGQSEPFAEVARFVHSESFALEGAHGDLACADCHGPESGREIAAYGSAGGANVRSCNACHESPHGPSIPQQCTDCHDPRAEGFGNATRAPADLEWHRDFPLDGPHLGLDCAQCHGDGGTYAERFPGRAPEDCAACHEDPHLGQFGEARTCLDCHARARYTPSLLADPALAQRVHRERNFELDGAHISLECAACHSAEVAGSATFRGTAKACAACHDDPHAGRFSLLGAEDCSTCHGTDGFDLVELESFDHGRWTGVPLEGAHARAACTTCHLSVEDFDLASLLGGNGIEEAEGPEDLLTRGTAFAEDCAGCHGRPHGGGFAEGQSCRACHGDETFALDPFDHLDWTDHGLVGPHAALACGECHRAPVARPEPPLGSLRDRVHPRGGPLLWSMADPGCSACHEDPHGTTFEYTSSEGAIETPECTECHGEEHRGFEQAVERFEHGTWARFPLDGAHGDLECSACHEPTPSGSGLGPAPGASCSDCHGDPHGGQFREEGDNDCSQCHSTKADFASDLFDHGATKFELTGVHEELACAACHRPTRARNGRTLIRYRPLGTACSDCHGLGDER